MMPWIGQATERWVRWVVQRPLRTITASILVSAIAAGVAATSLGLDTDEDAMFSSTASYAAKRATFEAAFPALTDPVIILIEGADGAAVARQTQALKTRLLAQAEHFPAVLDPESRSFFERHGLLYLPTDELADVVDKLIAAQPLLGHFAQNPSLHGLAGMLSHGLESEAPPAGFQAALQHITTSLAALNAGQLQPPDWHEIFGLQSIAAPHNRYLLVRPVVDHSLLKPADDALAALRHTLAELGLQGREPGAVQAHITGIYPLSSEEAHLVDHQVRRAGLASLLLVSCLLIAGLRSWRWAACLLLTLLVGLSITAGITAVTVGRLNLITIAFAVLFIGLSVDFGIHLLLRFRELLGTGLAPPQALLDAARTTGASLMICAVTTAIGFFAFVPTAFTGVSELGLICGIAMFVSLVANLTLLPALLSLYPDPCTVPPPAPPAPQGNRYRNLILAGCGAATVGAVIFLPAVQFDHNPLRLRDPATESVQSFERLLRDGTAFPWNMNSLADSPAAARHLSAQLEALPSVARTLTLQQLVPDEQAAKLALLENLELFFGTTLTPAAPRTNPAETRAALSALLLQAQVPGTDHTRQRFADQLGRILDRADRTAAHNALHTVLVVPLMQQLDRLRTAIQPTPITLDTLLAEPELASQHITVDGRMRIEIYPAADLSDNAALKRFVLDVQSISPDAFGEAVVIYESGRIVVESFKRALLIAALAILLIIAALWRNIATVLLISIPIAFAALLTPVVGTLIGISLNFANVIVIPLLLGIGIDSSIHLVHRHHDTATTALLHTSTARAVVLSALTTLASFGTLAFTSHPGMSSLGQLLTLGIALMLLSNLLLLPRLITLPVFNRSAIRRGRNTLPARRPPID